MSRVEPKVSPAEFHWHPATAAKWSDLEELFGPRGACAGCWCMFWRLPRKEWTAGKGEGNRLALRRVVGSRRAPGVLGYVGHEAVAWCAVAPREIYVSLANSRVLAPVDDARVWSISCLFVKRGWRRKGLSVRMIRAAAEFAASKGAEQVEAYPIVPTGPTAPDAFVWTGIPSAFEAVGFREVLRRSKTRPILRLRCASPEAAPKRTRRKSRENPRPARRSGARSKK